MPVLRVNARYMRPKLSSRHLFSDRVKQKQKESHGILVASTGGCVQ